MMRVLVVVIAACAAPAWGQISAIAGHWESPNGDHRVEITDCGDGSPCGHITWIAGEEEEKTLDRFNPDVSLRSRHLVGVPVLWGFRQTENDWEGGRVYDWSCGDTLSSRLSLENPETLKVKGCFGLLCFTQRWRRVAHGRPSPEVGGTQ